MEVTYELRSERGTQTTVAEKHLKRGNSKHKGTEDELNLTEIESLRLNLSDQKQMDNGQGT